MRNIGTKYWAGQLSMFLAPKRKTYTSIYYKTKKLKSSIAGKQLVSGGSTKNCFQGSKKLLENHYGGDQIL